MSLDRPSLLLSLPDPCLSAVLQFCAAAGPQTVCSAARAHSRLHALAAAALSSINEFVNQQQADSLQVYLSRHGQALSRLRLLHLQGPLNCQRDQRPQSPCVTCPIASSLRAWHWMGSACRRSLAVGTKVCCVVLAWRPCSACSSGAACRLMGTRPWQQRWHS